MSWTLINNGRYSRYQNKSLPEIVFLSPNWFFAQYEMGEFNHPAQLRLEADDVADKARRIKIRQTGSPVLCAEYFLDYPTATFTLLEIVPISKPLHVGSSPSFRKNVFDLKIPRVIRPAGDRLGDKILTGVVKSYIFRRRPTSADYEAFFDDPHNFDTAQSTIFARYPCTSFSEDKWPPQIRRLLKALDRVRRG